MRKYLPRWNPILALLVATPFLPGCMLELLTATAIQSELQAQSAASSMKQLEHTRRMADEIKISNAIDIYRAENGAYPPSLQALVPEYLDEVPVDPAGRPLYAYDARSGWFGDASDAPSGTGGSAMTAMDSANIGALEVALSDYKAMYGNYPPQLSELAPRFIDFIPTQANGQPYTYFSDTGQVFHPAELQSASDSSPAPARRSSAPIGGGSPAAEQMQAIGIMNDLNAQPHPTAGPPRQQLNDITKQQNEQYDKLLNDLNL